MANILLYHPKLCLISNWFQYAKFILFVYFLLCFNSSILSLLLIAFKFIYIWIWIYIYTFLFSSVWLKSVCSMILVDQGLILHLALLHQVTYIPGYSMWTTPFRSNWQRFYSFSFRLSYIAELLMIFMFIAGTGSGLFSKRSGKDAAEFTSPIIGVGAEDRGGLKLIFLLLLPSL